MLFYVYGGFQIRSNNYCYERDRVPYRVRAVDCDFSDLCF